MAKDMVDQFIIPVPENDPRLFSHVSQAFTLVDLGKRLLDSSKNGDVEEAKHLINSGAPFTTDWLGISPLHFAAMNGHLTTCEALLQAGISRDARSKVDRTPLHLAAQEGHADIVDLLLRNGADLHARDMLRMTAIHWAAERGHTPVVQVLKRYGADACAQNKFDLSAIDIAKAKRHYDAVEALLNTAVDPSLVALTLSDEGTRQLLLSSGSLSVNNQSNSDGREAYILTDDLHLVLAAPPADEVVVTCTDDDEGKQNIHQQSERVDKSIEPKKKSNMESKLPKADDTLNVKVEQNTSGLKQNEGKYKVEAPSSENGSSKLVKQEPKLKLDNFSPKSGDKTSSILQHKIEENEALCDGLETLNRSDLVSSSSVRGELGQLNIGNITDDHSSLFGDSLAPTDSYPDQQTNCDPTTNSRVIFVLQTANGESYDVREVPVQSGDKLKNSECDWEIGLFLHNKEERVYNQELLDLVQPYILSTNATSSQDQESLSTAAPNEFRSDEDRTSLFVIGGDDVVGSSEPSDIAAELEGPTNSSDPLTSNNHFLHGDAKTDDGPIEFDDGLLGNDNQFGNDSVINQHRSDEIDFSADAFLGAAGSDGLSDYQNGLLNQPKPGKGRQDSNACSKTFPRRSKIAVDNRDSRSINKTQLSSAVRSPSSSASVNRESSRFQYLSVSAADDYADNSGSHSAQTNSANRAKKMDDLLPLVARTSAHLTIASLTTLRSICNQEDGGLFSKQNIIKERIDHPEDVDIPLAFEDEMPSDADDSFQTDIAPGCFSKLDSGNANTVDTTDEIAYSNRLRLDDCDDDGADVPVQPDLDKYRENVNKALELINQLTVFYNSNLETSDPTFRIEGVGRHFGANELFDWCLAHGIVVKMLSEDLACTLAFVHENNEYTLNGFYDYELGELTLYHPGIVL